MVYRKPELTVLGAAAETIQGQKQEGLADSEPHQEYPSIAAYEADE